MIKCTFEDGVETHLRHCVTDCVVYRDNQILLVKRTKKLKEGGKWGLPGGYIDPGEIVEAAAKREVLEETGWEVADMTFARVISNPNRRGENRQNIAFIFFCHATKETGTPDWESDEVKWFDLDKIPSPDQIAFDHLDNIELYRRYLKEKLPLPILS